MLARFGFIIRRFFGYFLSRVKVTDEYRRTIEALADRGQLVYVLQTRSRLDALLFNYILLKNGYPLARYVHGVNLFMFRPVGEIFRLGWAWLKRKFGGPPPEEAMERLRRSLEDGGGALLFLMHSRRLVKDFFSDYDPLYTLIEHQGSCDRPIFLVPQYVAWERSPVTKERTIRDILFGEKDNPGRFRKVLIFLRNYRKSSIHAGEPIDLQEFLKDHPDRPKKNITRQIKRDLFVRIDSERRLVKGPRLKSRLEMKEKVLADPALRKFTREQAEREGKSEEEVFRRAANYLEEIAANYNITYIQLLEKFLGWSKRTFFDGLEVDQESIDRVKAASKRASVVLLPNHRSHFDYLYLSYVFYHNRMVCPHIAAGQNLNFWPVGPIFRNSGAFFLRRSFRKMERLYHVVFETYIKWLLGEEYPVEFFLEGGRSRTGLIRRPMLGILSMVVKMYLAGGCRKLLFVPVAFDYDRIFEEKMVVNEGLGGRKKKESAGGALKMLRHIRSRRGLIHISFGEPLSMSDLLGEKEPAELHPAEGRDIIRRLAGEIVREVARVSTITATSLLSAVLLGCPRPVPRSFLIAKARRLGELLALRGARLAPALKADAWAELTLRLDILRDNELVREERAGVSAPAEAAALVLDYYKNCIMNAAAPLAFLAAALLESEEAGRPAALETYRRLEELFGRDYLLPETKQGFESALETFIEAGLVNETGESEGPRLERLEIEDRETLRLLARLSGHLAESCILVLETASRPAAVEEAGDSHAQALEVGRSLIASGGLVRRECVNRGYLGGAADFLREKEILHGADGSWKIADPGAAARLRREIESLLSLLREGADDAGGEAPTRKPSPA